MPTRRRLLLFGAAAAIGGAGYLTRQDAAVPASAVSTVTDRLNPTWQSVSDAPWDVRWEVDVDGRPTATAQPSDGSVIVAGRRSAAESAPGWFCEIDVDGAVRTARTLPRTASNGPPSAILPTANGVLIGGDNDGDTVWVVALNEGGADRWVNRYQPAGGSGRAPLAILSARSTDAAYTLVSQRESFDDWRDSAWLLGVDANGRVRWNRTYDADVSYIDSACALDASTSLLVGRLDGTDGVESPAGALAIERGGVAWRRTYPASVLHDVAPAVADGSAAVAVGQVDRRGRDGVGVIARLSKRGRVQWWRTLGSDDGALTLNGVQPTSRGYLLTGLLRREDRDDMPFYGLFDPGTSSCRCYRFDRPRGARPLLVGDQLLSVSETAASTTIRSLGRT
ncbi:MAG: hypothetical protein ABEI27_08075 [Halobellus sp.]|uniref:hypothetical protein n=1 Tax=Halobellus sp. TaxID=1979212 RepID=UPI0035D4D763